MKRLPLRRPAVALLLGIAAVLGATAACEDNRVYVYTAQKWNATDACVEAYAPLEVVDGDGADATCAPVCMTNGTDVFVSAVCPPLPFNVTEVTSASDPNLFDTACRPAIAASIAKRTCGAPVDAAATDASDDVDASPAVDANDAAPMDATSDAPEDTRPDVTDAADDG